MKEFQFNFFGKEIFVKNLAEAKRNFSEAKKVFGDMRKRQVELNRQQCDLEELVAVLQNRLSEAQSERSGLLDAYIKGEATKSDLEKHSESLLSLERECQQTQELMSAIGRCLWKLKSEEIPQASEAVDRMRRGVWESVVNDIRQKVPDESLNLLQRLIYASIQCCRTKTVVLNELLPNLNTLENEALVSDLMQEYGIPAA